MSHLSPLLNQYFTLLSSLVVEHDNPFNEKLNQSIIDLFRQTKIDLPLKLHPFIKDSNYTKYQYFYYQNYHEIFKHFIEYFGEEFTPKIEEINALVSNVLYSQTKRVKQQYYIQVMHDCFRELELHNFIKLIDECFVTNTVNLHDIVYKIHKFANELNYTDEEFVITLSYFTNDIRNESLTLNHFMHYFIQQMKLNNTDSIHDVYSRLNSNLLTETDKLNSYQINQYKINFYNKYDVEIE